MALEENEGTWDWIKLGLNAIYFSKTVILSWLWDHDGINADLQRKPPTKEK
jgi:hypothetical protein